MWGGGAGAFAPHLRRVRQRRRRWAAATTAVALAVYIQGTQPPREKQPSSNSPSHKGTAPLMLRLPNPSGWGGMSYDIRRG